MSASVRKCLKSSEMPEKMCFSMHSNCIIRSLKMGFCNEHYKIWNQIKSELSHPKSKYSKSLKCCSLKRKFKKWTIKTNSFWDVEKQVVFLKYTYVIVFLHIFFYEIWHKFSTSELSEDYYFVVQRHCHSERGSYDCWKLISEIIPFFFIFHLAGINPSFITKPM